MRLILFGAGDIGKEALLYFGSSNVLAFCDNKVIGDDTSIRFGIKIISFEKLKEIYKNNIIVICVGNNFVEEIRGQLDEAGIEIYFEYDILKRMGILKIGADQLMAMFQDHDEQYRLLLHCQKALLNQVRGQLDYLKRHADITALKPATGKLRKRQLALVDYAIEFFDFIAELEIKPFLTFGNLVGAVRHQGFVPWDDDLDFGLIRRDYEKLLAFAREKCIVKCLDFYKDSRVIYEIIRTHPNQYFVNIDADVVRVCRHMPDGNEFGIDIWVYDFYKNEYDIKNHLKYLEQLMIKRHQMTNAKETIEFLKSERENNAMICCEETENFFPGIDNFSGYPGLKRVDKWISTKDIFPLKKVKYEHAEFWAPKNMEILLSYEYPDFMEFPYDVGIQAHGGVCIE